MGADSMAVGLARGRASWSKGHLNWLGRKDVFGRTTLLFGGQVGGGTGKPGEVRSKSDEGG